MSDPELYYLDEDTSGWEPDYRPLEIVGYYDYFQLLGTWPQPDISKADYIMVRNPFKKEVTDESADVHTQQRHQDATT